MDALRMIEAPSGSKGSAFCTVNSRPFTLPSKSESKCSSVILPRGATFNPPALANTMSSVPFSRVICAKRRSRSPRFDTSPWTPVTWPPISLTAAANSGSRRPVMKTYAPSCTNCFAVARPMPLLPPVMRAIFPSSLFMYSSSYRSLSDSEDDPAEGAALHQVPQRLSRFGQGEGLGHDRCDRAGLQQRDESIPGSSPGRLRLSEQDEALDADPLPDQMGDVNGGLAACRITQCGEASAQRKRSERLAQDCTTDPVDHHVCAVTVCDTTHAVTQLLEREINDLMESERLRLLGFRMIGRAGEGVFGAQGPRQLRHCVADRSSDRRRQHGFARLKTSQAESHLRGEIRDRHPGGADVVDTLRYQAKALLPDGKPFTVGSLLK